MLCFNSTIMKVEKTFKDCNFEMKMSEEDNRKVKVVISTEAVDRDGDSMSLAGIDTSYYQKNPVVLWNHNHGVPIAKAENLKVENGKMIADAVFPEKGVSPRSDEIYGLIRAGVINTASIGFMPKDFDRMPDGVWKVTKSELMEFSFVSIPSNREAVIIERAAEGKKLEKEEENKASQEQRAREIEILTLKEKS